MSKKTTLLALAAVSAAVCVLPAAASANWGVTEVNAEFNGTGGSASLFAAGEPTITCAGPNTSSGKYNNLGTTGTMDLHFTKCGTTIVFRFPCSTTEKPSSETISTKGTFHNVTITEANRRGVLLTPEPIVIKCESVGNSITVAGFVIGEVTGIKQSNPCVAVPGVQTFGINFGTTGSPRTQVHKTTFGHNTEYDLSATTAGGSPVTAALEATLTNTFANPSQVTIDCNNP
jgi:hypothetical protein